MVCQVALAVFSDGLIERLPEFAKQDDVLGTQGQVLTSILGLDCSCQLVWRLTSAYLSSQVNALCSLLSGQLIRGDAILKATLGSPGEAQAWINSISLKGRTLNGPAIYASAAGSPDGKLLLRGSASVTGRAANLQDDRLGNPYSAQAHLVRIQCFSNGNKSHRSFQETAHPPCRNPVAEICPKISQPFSREDNKSSTPLETAQPPRPSPVAPGGEGGCIVKKQKNMQGAGQASHPAYAVPDDCEPRMRLLWATTGQASSVKWPSKPPLRLQGSVQATPPCEPPESAVTNSEDMVEAIEADRLQSSAGHSSEKRGYRQGGESSSEGQEDPQEAGRRDDSSMEASDPCRSCWADLQPEILGLIAEKLSLHTKAIERMIGTCRQWRMTILRDSQLLQSLQFRDPDDRPWHAPNGVDRPYPRATGLPITLLAHEAAKGGSLSACVITAAWLDTLGFREEAMRYHKRAAKLGDPMSQVMFGEAAYLGKFGVLIDSEEAYRWLSRGANQLSFLDPLAEGLTARYLARCRALSTAALHLGWLTMDGEGTKMDLESAVSWFKTASKYGSRDADIILGTLLRTGQYGPR